ncbi:MAG: c-type cytochrome [Candidatus Nitrohelix vancouverensis]|uniref:C-type cytochrome n=1 Tax=Candidatus Nitrohelix vancouverensis TaxID=2705534 RepID=A0A7T0C5B4_9BACT|nr:MAG: c-type cytochrome [Candidatus Nitrohelix vancouverensis]
MIQRIASIFLFSVTACLLAQSVVCASELPSSKDMPESIQFNGKTIPLNKTVNPLPADPENLEKGATVYFQHCLLCHGDLLDGQGVFADRFFPPPVSFIHENSPITQPDSYLFWRIAKGGMGLPEKFKPWSSVMPAWENQLSEEEIWNVIHFIRNRVMDRLDTPSAPQEVSLEQGKALYAKHCVFCHGSEGDGDGISADVSSPKPQKLTKGHIKLRSTAFGKIPTDEDLFDAITRGMNHTTMPPWSHLSVNDRKSLVLFVKTLSSKFEKFVKKNKTHEIIDIPQPAPFTLASVERGKDLFIKNCSACHGIKGRGDGASTYKIVDLETNALWPRNLSQSWTFRRGSSRTDIFKTIRTGLSGTAMPRFSDRIFNDEQIWDIVNYVETLSPAIRPETNLTLKVQRIKGSVPLDPEDELWKKTESYFFPVGGQIMVSEKAYYPFTESVSVKALHNGEDIAFYLQWDDPHHDPILASYGSVQESPPPPLPPELQVNEPVQQKKEFMAQEFPDAIAIQFPSRLPEKGPWPYFLNGDAERSVNLWKWTSHPLKATEFNAKGLSQWSQQAESSQALESKARFAYGRYHLVVKRKMMTGDLDTDIQFLTGKTIPIAFNVWNGSAGETGSRKAVSSWGTMLLK